MSRSLAAPASRRRPESAWRSSFGRRHTRASPHRAAHESTVRRRPRSTHFAGGCIRDRGCPRHSRGEPGLGRTGVIPVVLLLLAAVLLYVGLALWGRQERAALGLGVGAIVAADQSSLGAPTLRSTRYGLVGRPDQLLRVGSMVIPVERKPSARKIQQSHLLQLAAQCLLVDESYGVRPSYGLLVLAGGRQVQVEYTRALERRVLETMEQMRGLLRAGTDPGPRWVAPKCRPCGFRARCWESQHGDTCLAHRTPADDDRGRCAQARPSYPELPGVTSGTGESLYGVFCESKGNLPEQDRAARHTGW